MNISESKNYCLIKSTNVMKGINDEFFKVSKMNMYLTIIVD